MFDKLKDWWWHAGVAEIGGTMVHPYGGGSFIVYGANREILQEATIFEVRQGSYFFLTDAILRRGPGKPTMVGFWGVSSTPEHAAKYTGGICSTYRCSIRHFSEADYVRSKALGFEQGWNDAADRFVAICEARPRRLV